MASQLVRPYSFDGHIVECKCLAGDAGVASLCDVALRVEDVAHQWIRSRSGDGATEEDWTARQVELTEQRDDEDHKRN
jgi:hypothetical protein